MTDYFSKAPHLHDCKIGPHHDECTCGLEVARNEIERLNSSNDALMRERTSMIQTHRASITGLIAERNEARAENGRLKTDNENLTASLAGEVIESEKLRAELAGYKYAARNAARDLAMYILSLTT